MTGNLYTLTVEDLASWPRWDYIVDRQWLPPLSIAWMSVTTILVVARFQIRPLRAAEDWMLLMAWLFAVAFTSVACTAVWRYDIGRHIWQLSPSKYDGAAFQAWLGQIYFIHATGAIKCSIMLFYARMAKNYHRGWLITVYVLLSITAASWIAMFIAYCFMCQPLNAYWTIHFAGIGEYTCLNGSAMTIASSVITIASDFWAAALPCVMFYVNDLGITPRQRLGLNLLFCAGFSVTGAAIARTVFLWQFSHESDNTWIGYNLCVACLVETQLSITCACAPFIRAFIRKFGYGRTTDPDQYTSASYEEPINYSRPLRLSSFDKDIETLTKANQTKPLEQDER